MMLIFSGLGSLASPRLSQRSRYVVIATAGAVAISLTGYRLVLDPLLQATLALPLPTRIVLTLMVLALPATLMGIPFPAAVAQLGDTRRDLVVRGWILNGYFSVLGACLAMMISISFGFGTVLLLSATIYALAALLWSRALKLCSI